MWKHRLLGLPLATAASLALATPASALTINFVAGGAGLPALHTLLEDFTATPSGAGYGIHTLDVPGVAARPHFGIGDTPFLAVYGGGAYHLNLALPALQLSFDLGSLDTYNRLTLWFDDATSMVMNGSEIQGIPGVTVVNSGHQTAPTHNGRLTFDTTGGPLITGVTFASDQNSFEVDHISANSVPEPGTWISMLLGFGLLGMAIRRRGPVKSVLQ